MNIFLNKLNENWIVDRLRTEWYRDNKSISTKYINFADLIWIIAPWQWTNISKKHLETKTVVCSIYHIEEEKMNDRYLKEFYERDSYVSEYHVISKKTKTQLEKLTDKKITSIPFWVNQKIFFEIKDKTKLRKKYNFQTDEYLVGSFQRDSEGENPKLPKLVKGPDQFIEIVKKLNESNEKLKVLLTGKRRDYVINELRKNDINYELFEMVDFTTLNELYNCLDLYIVASRIEGGPQSILECATNKTPIISTDVGVASEILSKDSIFELDNFSNSVPNIEFAYNSSLKFHLPSGYDEFINFFNKFGDST